MVCPPGARYRACHRPDGSLRNAPNRRLLAIVTSSPLPSARRLQPYRRLRNHGEIRSRSVDNRSRGGVPGLLAVRVNKRLEVDTVDAQVLAELHKRKPPFGAKAADEAGGCPESVGNLIDRQQPR